MAKIIGNTTATPNPRPDWNQIDDTKADYIKNKPVILTEEDVIGLIAENGSSGDGSVVIDQIQSDWNQTDETKADYIKNKPTIVDKFSEDENGKLLYKGEQISGSGESGATFIPSVSKDGDLSWSNDKGLDNPVTVNIKGESGVYVGSGNMPEDYNVQIDPDAEGELIIPEVLQTTGNSTEDTMSQKAITELFQNGIVQDNHPQNSEVPDYIKKEAKRVAENIQSTRTPKTFVMICGSDMHLKDGDNAKNHTQSRVSAQYAGMGIKEIKNCIGVDCVTLLGDYSWMNAKDYSAGQTMKDLMLAKQTLALDGSTKELFSVGNHDWCYGEGVDRLLTEDEIYAYIGANSNGVKPYADIERGYGYVDFENYKIRVINLNTCDCKDSKDNGLNFKDSSNYPRIEFISPTQMRWVADEALDLTDKDDGWGVIFVSHHPLDYGSVWFSDFLKMLEAYNNGNSVTLNLYKYHNGSEWIRQSETFDFTTIENKAEIICNVHGHSHNCGSAKVSSGSSISPWLWRFCIPNMCVGRENEKWNTIHGEVDSSGNAIYHRKETNTEKSTSFNVVSIDRKNQKIYAYIFGAGIDRAFYYGEKEITSYSVNTTLNNCIGESANATNIEPGSTATLKFTANDGYILPNTVSVSGASYVWDKSTGTLVLSDPVSDIFVTVTAVSDEPTALLDMSVRTLDTSYTEDYVEDTGVHTMDYAKAYATTNDYCRGAQPTTKFSDFTPINKNSFSVNCNSSSGYRIEFPVNVESGKSYEFNATTDAPTYSIKLLKYNPDTTFNSASDLLYVSDGTTKTHLTITAEEGYLYSISFPFSSGTRTYNDVSLTEA